MSDDFADLSNDLSADPAAEGMDSGSFSDDLMSTQFVDMNSEDLMSGDGPQVIAEPAVEPVADVPNDDASVQMVNGDSSYYAGDASLDSDGDGVMDTAVQDNIDVNGNEQIEYYIDEDGDHQADQLIITDADGNLVSNTEMDDTTGEFVETDFTGELGPDGPSVADTNAAAEAPAEQPAAGPEGNTQAYAGPSGDAPTTTSADPSGLSTGLRGGGSE